MPADALSPAAAVPPSSARGSRAGRAALAVAIGYAVLAVVMLGSRLPTVDEGVRVVSTVTQCLLAPVLALGLVATVPRPYPRLVRWALAALGWCFLGDLLPTLRPGFPVGFALMLGCFLVAQVAWIAGFAPWRGPALRGARAWVAAGYVVVAVALLVVCLPQAGPLVVPVVVYAAALTTMAVLALGIGRLTAWGAALFLASDSLIALGVFAPWPAPAGHSLWVMATYAAGLALLTLGVAHASRGPLARPAATALRSR